MESLETISKLEIPTKNIIYDKKSKLLSIDILGFAFVGHYKKSTKIREILDDIYSSLEKVKVEREYVYFLDMNNVPVPETIKLKDIDLEKEIEKKEETIGKVGKKGVEARKRAEEEKHNELLEKRNQKYHDLAKARKRAEEEAMQQSKQQREPEISKSEQQDLQKGRQQLRKKALARAKKSKDKMKRLRSDADETTLEEITEDEEDFEGEMLKDEISDLSKSKSEREIAAPASRSAAQPAPGGAMGGAGAAPKAPAPEPVPPPAPSPALTQPVIEPEESKETTYNINMGFQYYSVMMEQKSYLFYVYLSHEELKILDEEGKTVYKTTFTITTLKKEPPVLDLRIEGEGFEIHPLTGKIVVKKEAVNPPVMIFSILPLKQLKKKRKKKSERRYLNVYIEFEGKLINHTVMSAIIQPKHFHLDLGPIQIDISKRTAFLISFISVLIATGSTIFSAITLETTSFVDIVSGFVPGLASFIFFAVFIITLIKNGIYPLKQKWSALLKFDKGIEMMK